ncbi:Uncharacterised protein [Staphylococcus aureus]|nr:Uncharacterised protein [Staphylococcus aureus]
MSSRGNCLFSKTNASSSYTFGIQNWLSGSWKITPLNGSTISSSYFIGNSIKLGTIPLNTFRSVLLPQPEGPSKSTFSLS